MKSWKLKKIKMSKFLATDNSKIKIEKWKRFVKYRENQTKRAPTIFSRTLIFRVKLYYSNSNGDSYKFVVDSMLNQSQGSKLKIEKLNFHVLFMKYVGYVQCSKSGRGNYNRVWNNGLELIDMKVICWLQNYYYRGTPDNTASISPVPGLTRIFLKGNSTDSSI